MVEPVEPSTTAHGARFRESDNVMARHRAELRSSWDGQALTDFKRREVEDFRRWKRIPPTDTDMLPSVLVSRCCWSRYQFVGPGKLPATAH